MTRNGWKLAVIVVLACFTITLYGQQQGGPPQGGPPQDGGFKNLKVFPKEMTRQQLMGIMQGWTRALGVQCDHCHVMGEMDKDEKPEKDVTRAMVKMMQNLRANANDFLPDNRIQKVSCWTCHRGSAKIELPAPPQQQQRPPQQPPAGEKKPPQN
jgi:hypothetical protein